MLEYLRKNGEISRLELQSQEVQKLNEELSYWGISLLVKQNEGQNQLPLLSKLPIGGQVCGTQGAAPLCNLNKLAHQN